MAVKPPLTLAVNKRYLPWLAAALAILAVWLAAAVFYRAQFQQMRQQVETQLTTIETLKIAQIMAWRSERQSDAGALMGSPFLIDGIARWWSEPQPAVTEKLLERFRTLQQAYRYHDVVLLSLDGRIRLSLNKTGGPLGEDDRVGLETALRDRQPVLTDIHADPQHPFPHLGLIAPLFHDADPASAPLGAILLIVDARKTLYPLLDLWPTPSVTAETYLVRRDGDEVLYLNELRHQPDTALNLRLPLSRTGSPAVRAVLGETGISEGPDYRGIKVIAVSQPVPGTPWFLVAKMDEAEAFAALRRNVFLSQALGVAGLGLLFVLGLTVWQTREKRHYKSLFKAEAARHESEERYALVMRAIDDGIWDWNVQTHEAYFSPRYKAILGYADDELPNQAAGFFDWIHSDDRDAVTDALRRHWDDHHPYQVELRLRHKDGGYRWVFMRGEAMRDSDGRPVRMVGAITDITERKEATEATLKTSEERLRMAQQAAKAGLWDWDMASGEIFWSEEFYALFDLPASTPPSHDAVLNILHKDDLKSFSAKIEEAIGKEIPFENDYRIVCRDGRVRWIKAIGDTHYDQAGQPQRMIGLCLDVTERRMAEQKIRDNEERHRFALETLNVGEWELNLAEHIAIRSLLHDRIFGYETLLPEWTYELFLEHVLPEDREQVSRLFAQAVADNAIWDFECRIRRADGQIRWIHARGKPRANQRGQPVLIGIVMDITDRQQAVEALRENEERLRLAIGAARLGIWHWNLATDELVWSPNCLAMFGLPPGEPVTYTKFLGILHPEDRKPTDQAVRLALEKKEDYKMEYRAIWPDGSEHWIVGLGCGFYGPDGIALFMEGVTLDITEKKKSEELIWQQANFDALTGLPNRRMVCDRLEQEVKKSHREKLSLALMFVDLDHFKEINDSLGHEMGDILLKEVALRMTGCVRETDIVGRLGGDEFTVILSELDDIVSVERVAHAILSKVAAPYQLGSELAYTAASIGVTLYPHDATDVATLLKYADQAMYAAKQEGRNRFHYYTPAMQEAANFRLMLVNDLHNALEYDQFRLHYQPIVELATGAIHKAEALIRWQHPTLGLLNPADFIPIAEETGLIVEIADWVFHQAATEASRLRVSIHPEFQISVNKSHVQFRGKSDNQAAWMAHLVELGLPGQSIAIEITESLLMESKEGVNCDLLAFRDGGMEVSLDDFGTGHSSLSYLQRFDIDYLKIDRSFVHNLAPDSNDLALCEAIVVMAHKLGIKVIAEGIETQGQCDILRQIGCDYGQGYLFSKPLPADEFEKLVRVSRGVGKSENLAIIAHPAKYEAD